MPCMRRTHVRVLYPYFMTEISHEHLIPFDMALPYDLPHACPPFLAPLRALDASGKRPAAEPIRSSPRRGFAALRLRGYEQRWCGDIRCEHWSPDAACGDPLGISQIPPDLVVKFQTIDIVEVI